MHYMLYLKRLGLGLNLMVTKRSGMRLVAVDIANNTALDKKVITMVLLIMVIILCHIWHPPEEVGHS